MASRRLVPVYNAPTSAAENSAVLVSKKRSQDDLEVDSAESQYKFAQLREKTSDLIYNIFQKEQPDRSANHVQREKTKRLKVTQE